MSDLQDLYQSIILDHNRRPKNYGSLDGATNRAEGRNPLCGDEVAVELKVQRDAIEDVRFTATGCAVSRAAASIMTQAVKGKSRVEVDRLFTQFHELVTGKLKPTPQEAFINAIREGTPVAESAAHGCAAASAAHLANMAFKKGRRLSLT